MIVARREDGRVTLPLLNALASEQRVVAASLSGVFTAAGQELVFVGGIVRDLLLGRRLPNDLDFATSALPEDTQRLGQLAGAGSAYLVGERFGTVGFVFARQDERIDVEITTYRSENYPDETRFPTVQLGGGLAEDLARRDFTANAIAVDVATEEMSDPFGGEADIAQGILRAVGDPDARFAEDPLRLLRAVRFVAQLGFRLEAETEAAVRRNAPSLARISQERILMELTKLLVGNYVEDGLEALRGTGLLQLVMPELAPLAAEADDDYRDIRPHREKDLWAHTKRVVRQAPPRPIVRWAALLHDAAKPLTRSVDNGEVHFFGHERVGADRAGSLLRRLKADKATQAAVRRLVELHGRPATYEEGWTDSAVRRLALEAGDIWDDLLDLAAADVTSAREDKQLAAAVRVAGLREHFDRLQAEAGLDQLQSPLDGNELMAIFQRPPGIWIKHVKDRLRELVIDGELASDDRATAERIAREILDEPA